MTDHDDIAGSGAVPWSGPAELDVILPNFKRHLSGVTSTVVTLAPILARHVRLATVGPGLPPGLPHISFAELLTLGRSRPPGRPARIWHCRRNNEMLAGVLLRDVLRQRLKLVFTSSAQRDHTAWTKALIDRMDLVIAGSRFAAAYLKRDHHTVPHSIDTARFSPAGSHAEAWARTGLPGRYGIGVTGRIRPQKGTDLFIDAMIRLLPRHPDFTAVVLGRAVKAEQPFLDGLKRKLAEAGLADRVVFTGEVPDADMTNWYSAMTIFVAPPRHEGYGLTPLEAMACGTVAVTSHAGAFPDIIRHGETGFLVPTGEIEPLVETLDRLMGDPALAERMGATGRRHVVERHSAEAEARQIVELYERLWRQDAA